MQTHQAHYEHCTRSLSLERSHGWVDKTLEVLHKCIPNEAFLQAELELKRQQKSQFVPLTRYALTYYAQRKDALAATIDYLIDKHPDQLHFCDDQSGKNLLALAIWNIAINRGTAENAQAIFDLVLERCGKQGSRTPDIFGRLALHQSLKWKAPTHIVKTILDHNAKGIYVADHNGETPVHLAALSSTKTKDPEGLFLLLRQDPGLLHQSFSLGE